MFVVHIEVYRKDEMDPTKVDQDRELLQWLQVRLQVGVSGTRV